MTTPRPVWWAAGWLGLLLGSRLYFRLTAEVLTHEARYAAVVDDISRELRRPARIATWVPTLGATEAPGKTPPASSNMGVSAGVATTTPTPQPLAVAMLGGAAGPSQRPAVGGGGVVVHTVHNNTTTINSSGHNTTTTIVIV